MPPITIDLDDETVTRIDAICTRFDLTTAQFIARAVRRLHALIEERDRSVGPSARPARSDAQFPWLSRWSRGR